MMVEVPRDMGLERLQFPRLQVQVVKGRKKWSPNLTHRGSVVQVR